MAEPLVEPDWTLAGEEIRLVGYHASVGFGGCLRAGGTVEAAVARRAEQGDELIAWVNEEAKWGGRVSRPPRSRGGTAQLEASGYRQKAERAAGRLFYASWDTRMFTPSDSTPWGYLPPGGHKFNTDVHDGALVWQLPKGSDMIDTDRAGIICAVPGTPGGITRYKADWKASNATTLIVLKPYEVDWPPGGGQNLAATHGLNAASGSIEQALANGRHALRFELESDPITGVTPMYTFILYNLRLYGIATSDVMFTSAIVTDMCARLGFDTAGVKQSSLNALPFDLSQGNWLEAGLFHMAFLDDWAPPNIIPKLDGSGPRALYGPWGEVVHTVSLERDAREDLNPLEIVNGVVVHYQSTGHPDAEITIRPTDIGVTDPLQGKDADNFIHVPLSDIQPDPTLATQTGKNLLTRVVRPRHEGQLEVVSVQDGTRWDLLAGHSVQAHDWGPAESMDLPIESVEFSEGQAARVSVYSPGAELGLAAVVGLGRARALQQAGFTFDEAAFNDALKEWRKDRGQINKELRRFYSGGPKGERRDFAKRREELLRDLHEKDATKGTRKTARRGLKELRKDRREREKELLAEQEEQLVEEPYPEDFFEPFP